MKKPENQPTLRTERLCLRPLRMTDAEIVQRYVGDARVAGMMTTIPHPYPPKAAEEWIATQEERTEMTFAITRAEIDELVGVIGISPEPNGLIAEIGFWIAVPFWGNGYCTEAAREILRFCFEDLELQRVCGVHFAGNEASGQVQRKIGMRHEGVQRWGMSRFGVLKDRECYGIILPDWEVFLPRPKGRDGDAE
jgi:[ribosomal protein S5]-alanine N-acetyltransferase